MRSGSIHISLVRVLALVVLGAGMNACDKAPLLAPTSSTISVTAPTRVLPLGGSTEITAYVTEQAGTSVQNGTSVRFTTSLGRVDPVDAQTHNGMATTTFFAGDVSGVAEVRATSGNAGAGAGTTTPGGTAGGTTTPTTTTAGNAVQITVGAAAVDSVTVRTNPATVSSNGGTVDVVASVLGTGGRVIPGVTVTFSADHGTLSSTAATTDANGEAHVQLTTNVDTTVSASAAGKAAATAAKVTAQVAPSVTLTCTSSTSANCAPLNVGDVAVFTAARAQTSSAIRSATLDFGDGTVVDLGNLSGSVTASHQYLVGGTYTVRLNSVDVNGEVATATLVVIVQESATVLLNLSNRGNRHIDATAQVLGCTPQRFDWNFGNNAVVQTLSTTGNSASADYTAGGTKTVTVSVRCIDGRTTNTSGQLTLDVNP